MEAVSPVICSPCKENCFHMDCLSGQEVQRTASMREESLRFSVVLMTNNDCNLGTGKARI